MQTAKTQNQSVNEYTEPVTMQKRIGSTTYRIGIYFNPDAQETLEEKIKRMLKNDLQSTHGNATIGSLQAGWLPEREVRNEQQAV